MPASNVQGIGITYNICQPLTLLHLLLLILYISISHIALLVLQNEHIRSLHKYSE